ncbi:MAG: LamG domain-containing protein, partial [Okeania sp. SIO3H1]|nr:LamG domain-containing protein [Okeania sp. SIO3H1]
MAYKDIVMGTNGETSPLSVLPEFYFPFETDVVNIGSVNPGYNPPGTDPTNFTGSVHTKDTSNIDNSTGSVVCDGTQGNGLTNVSTFKNRNCPNGFTLACWIRPDERAVGNFTARTIINNFRNPRGLGLQLLPGGVPIVYVTDTFYGGATTGAAVLPGQLSFIVGLLDTADDTVKIYQDGVLVNSASTASLPARGLSYRWQNDDTDLLRNGSNPRVMGPPDPLYTDPNGVNPGQVNANLSDLAYSG